MIADSILPLITTVRNRKVKLLYRYKSHTVVISQAIHPTQRSFTVGNLPVIYMT